MCLRLWASLLLLIGCCALRADVSVWDADPSFAPALESTVQPLNPFFQPSPGGKLLVGVRYAVNGIIARGQTVRLNVDGTTDPTFKVPAADAWNVLAVYPDGRVLSTRSNLAVVEVVRLLPTGAVDPTFSPIETDATGAVLAGNGRIFLLGVGRVGTTVQRGIAALDGNGALSASFRSPFAASDTVSVWSAVPLADGRVLIAGSFTALGPNRLQWVARLNDDGTTDPTFNANALALSSGPTLLGLNPDGTALVQTRSTLLRLAATGVRDNTFAPQLSGTPQAFSTIQPDGKIYYLSSDGLHRINRDGTADAAFFVGAPNSATIPAVADDGALFVSSAVTPARLANHQIISRLRSDGTLDPNFSPRFGDGVGPEAFLRLADGRVLLSGLFSYVSNVAMPAGRSFVRLNADGSLDRAFSATLGQYESVGELKVQPSGKILAVGTFTAADGSSRQLARFNADGSRDATFTLSPPNASTIAVDRDGYVYVGTFDSNPRLDRYTPDGQIDPGFHSSINDAVTRLQPLPDGAVLVLHGAAIGGVNPGIWTRVQHDGSVDGTFTLDAGAIQGSLIGLAPLPDGRVIFFTENSGTAGKYFRATRVLRTGAVDFTYVGRDTGVSVFQDYLSVGGVLYDALKEASPSTFAAVQADFAGSASASIYTDTGGALLLRGSVDAYRRSAVPGPSVNYAATVVLQSWQTNPVTLSLGRSFSLSASAGGLLPVSYQWFRNGAPIAGATTSLCRLTNVTASDAGDYTVTISNAYGTATTWPAQVNISGATTIGSARLANISTRGRVTQTDNLVAGFAITGSAPITVLIRAVGPALSAFGIGGALADPKVALYKGAAVLRESDNWGSEAGADSIASAAGRLGAFPLAANGKDAGLLVTLDPGAYTAVVSAVDNSGGVALIEVYDASSDDTATSRLINLSTRGVAGAGENVLVAGIVVGGTVPKRVLVRAIGPALADFGVAGVLTDPVLTVYSGSTVLQANDDWASSFNYPALASAMTAVGAFQLPFVGHDASLLLTLAPGNYTAQISGKGTASGVALVEVYEVP